MAKKKIKNEVGIILHFGLYSLTAFHDLKILKKVMEIRELNCIIKD